MKTQCYQYSPATPDFPRLQALENVMLCNLPLSLSEAAPTLPRPLNDFS